MSSCSFIMIFLRVSEIKTFIIFFLIKMDFPGLYDLGIFFS